MGSIHRCGVGAATGRPWGRRSSFAVADEAVRIDREGLAPLRMAEQLADPIEVTAEPLLGGQVEQGPPCLPSITGRSSAQLPKRETTHPIGMIQLPRRPQAARRPDAVVFGGRSPAQ